MNRIKKIRDMNCKEISKVRKRIGEEWINSRRKMMREEG